MSTKSTAQSRGLYRIDRWSEGYFDVDDGGRVVAATPAGARVQLTEVVAAAQRAGLGLPLLIRFNDILRDRVTRLLRAFDEAMAQQSYKGHFAAVYPIKVNQQRSVVEQILAHGNGRVGAETGSKPELLAVIAEAPSGGLIVCNGYKDRDYLRLEKWN